MTSKQKTEVIDVSADQLERGVKEAASNLETTKEKAALDAQVDSDQAGYTEERDYLNQAIGRIQMAHGLAKIANVFSISDLAEIKKHKKYKKLSNKTVITPAGKEIKNVCTWSGFCEAIGISHTKADEDIKNLETFGEETLNYLKQARMGYRDIRKLRKLPEDDQKIILAEAEASVGDKEAIVGLIDDLVTKHVKEKQDLQTSNERLSTESAEQKETYERLLADKNKKNDDLAAQLERRERMSPDERTAELEKDLIAGMEHAVTQMNAIEFPINRIFEWQDAPDRLHGMCNYAIDQMEKRVNQLRSHYGLFTGDNPYCFTRKEHSIEGAQEGQE